MLRMLEVIARVWRPDYARVMSREYDEHYALPDGALPVPGKPRVGWMTYLRAERLAGLPARVPCRTEQVDELGTIFVVTDEHRFSVENPEDVARAQALTAFLEEHGALRVIPTTEPI
jgi:hypothetical protein